MSPAETSDAPIRVFLIDDHITILWGLERLIETEGPRMRVIGKATSVASAIPLIIEGAPDVVVLDLDLGTENGLDAIPHLLESCRVKILVLTGVRDSAAHESAIRAGALGVIGKEAAPTELLQAIHRVHRGQLTVDQVTTERLLGTIARGSAAPPRSAEEAQIASLTARERDIVVRLREHPKQALREIAAALGITERTLRNHLTSIYDKLRVSGRLELYVFSMQHMNDRTD
ncbi:MAG TPA: response regulator transcription factor [Burkholderiales bacterium]|nr:response regulator transcription factor [Burkholderiales bacterium]